jgi:hypothetical protein
MYFLVKIGYLVFVLRVVVNFHFITLDVKYTKGHFFFCQIEQHRNQKLGLLPNIYSE